MLKPSKILTLQLKSDFCVQIGTKCAKNCDNCAILGSNLDIRVKTGVFILLYYQSSLNKSTEQISVTAKSTIDLAKQFEFRPIRSSKVQINQPVAFKIQIVQLILMY